MSGEDGFSSFVEGAKDVGLKLFALSEVIVIFLLVIGLFWHFVLHYYSHLPLPTRLMSWFRKRAGDRTPEELVGDVIDRLGYRKQSISNAREYVAMAAHDVQTITSDMCYERLVRLLARFIEKEPIARLYGRETPQESYYYVDTMAASHDIDTRREMATLLHWLITHRPPKSETGVPQAIDFVLTPKSGNPLLADALGQKLGYACLLRKEEREASRSRAVPAAASATIVNIEGLRALTAIAAGRRLRGVIVDCNCSGGSLHKRTMREFNDIVGELELNIEPVTSVYVLYRPDVSELAQLDASGDLLHVERFFDLTDDLKAQLYNACVDDEISTKNVKKIVQTIRSKGLLRVQ